MNENKSTETDTIITFLQRMSTQENHMTAWPHYFVVRTAKWVITDEDYASGNYRIRCVHNDDHETVITEEEYDALPVQCEDAVEDESGNKFCQDDFTRFCEVNVWQEEGMFFTETDAKGHLERNHYHYSKDAHVYCKHAWRAPELENFLLALHKHFGVEPRKDKGTM